MKDAASLERTAREQDLRISEVVKREPNGVGGAILTKQVQESTKQWRARHEE